MNKETSIASLALAANQKIKEKAYWLNRLSGQPVKSSFPYDHDHESGSVPYRLETLEFSLSQSQGIYRQISELSKGSNERLFIVLLTGVFILLQKYSGSRDILMGIPVTRPQDNTVLLNHALTIRTFLQDTVTFRKLLTEIRRTVIEAVDHQNFPIEILVDLLGMAWSPGQGFPLFDVVVSLKNIHHDTLHEFSPNIIVSFERNDRGINGMFSYNAGRYKSATIERLAAHYQALLEGALANLDIQISAIELLSEEEKQEILVSFNDSDADFPESTAVHELVDRQAGLTPQADAVIYKDQRLSYAVLKKKTDDVAAVLRQKGVAANTIVAVLFDHSPDMVVTLIGILKAGGAYLPMDPGFPGARIQYLVRDSGTKYIITADRYLDKIQDYREKVLTYNQLMDNSSPGFLSEEKRNHQPHHLAYIMYTSGSTGKPKGVMIEHRSFIDFITWAVAVFEHRPGYQVLLSNSYASDGSIQQIYPPLVSGGALHLIDKELRLDVARYLDYLKENRINNIDEAPVLMNVFLEQVESTSREQVLPDLTCLCMGGDYVPIELVRRCRKYLNHGGKIINAYGPAEASVEATFYYFEGTSNSEISLIGKPRSNTRVYILDQLGNCCPIGVRGEICISGIGLARGYLNKPEQTADKFITGANRSYISQRLYHTGDQGCWLPGGNIRFFGRIDDQIRVRGYRVELSEIEQVIKSHPGIKDAVVILRENKSGETAICAYYIGKLAGNEVRQYLENRLPAYMVPSYLMELECIPLTPNGKIDKKALPEPGSVSMGEYTPPRDNLETKLVAIWSEVLNLDPGTIGIHSNFFKMGGHSLKAAILTSRVQKQLDVAMPLIQVFKTPTIAGLAQFLHGAEKSRYTSIENTELKEYYPLTPVQKRLYFLQYFDTGSIAYNVTENAYLEKSVSIEKIKEIFKKIISRHEILRTSFKIIHEEPWQIIHKEVPVEIEENVDLENFSRPIDLSRVPLMRVGFLEQEGQNNMFIVDMHHIICDPFSPQILIDEFRALYNEEELPALRLQYRDYAAWQNRPEQKIKINQQGPYWKKLFSDNLPVLTLPTDFPRPLLQAFEGALVYFLPREEEARQLRNLAAENNVTMFMIILAIFNVFLAKISGQEDIIVGTPTSSRLHEDIEEMIGMFVNTLAMRSYPAEPKTFKAFLQEVKAQTLEAYKNQEYPFEDLVDEISPERDTSRNPLFDVMFNHLKHSGATVSFRESDLYLHKTAAPKFDITFTVEEYDNNFLFSIEYCSRLFKAETIDRMIGYFKRTYQAIIEDPHRTISAVQVISDEEKRWLLFDFNAAETAFPRDKTIQGLFEEQVARRPDSTALRGKEAGWKGRRVERETGAHSGQVLNIFGESVSLTYRQLNEEAHQLAHLLIEKGVKPDTLVAIMLERSLKAIVAILGILKAGGAYLPIDVDYPGERIQYMLKDSNAQVLVVDDTSYASCLSFAPKALLNLSEGHHLNFPASQLPGFSASLPSSLAYIIYTSGTTGKPKGTLIQHRNVVSLMFHDNYLFDFSNQDIWTMFHSYCFDFSVWEMYGALLYGGKLVMIPGMVTKDTAAYLEILKKETVTILNQTPPAFYILSDLEMQQSKKELKLRYIIFGGDALNPVQLNPWQEKYPGTKLINMFGITETTVHVTYKKMQKTDLESSISNIGRPIPTLNTYVMDRHLRLVPPGVAGEICVGGKGVCRGYLNRPELTAEKFASNPYIPGERIYRSGDLGRISAKGELEYMGRIDFQVKIRGFRIELGEIETLLLKHQAIKKSVVLPKEDKNGNRLLCAYIVADPETEVSEVKKYLSGRLPDYMVPSYILRLDKIPLTANGKVDRKALLELDIGTKDQYLHPRNETEEAIARIWCEVLELKRVGIKDNFFNIGGDSIKAIKLLTLINRTLQTNLKVVDLFINDTIEKLSTLIAREENLHIQDDLSEVRNQIEALKNRILTGNPLDVHDIEDIYPMSDIEKGMVFHSAKESKKGVYHDQFVHQVQYVDFDTARFEKALALMVEKHTTLRTSLHVSNFEEPVQIVHKTCRIDMRHQDISHMNRDQQEKYLWEFILSDLENPFDVTIAPLWRMRTFTLDEENIFVLWVFHHAILDGWSDAAFKTELNNIYLQLKIEPGFRPQPLKSSCKEFIIEQSAVKKNSQQLDFWRAELLDYKRLQFPAPRERSEESLFRKVCFMDLGNPLRDELERAAAAYHTSLKHLGFAGYVYLLGMFFSENDVTTGLVTNNRPLCEDGEKILGCFLNTSPVRIKIPDNIKWIDYIHLVQDKLVQLTKYNRISLFEIARLIGEEVTDQNPIFDTIFNFVDFHVYKQRNFGDSKESNLNRDRTDRISVMGHTVTNTLFDFSIETTMEIFTADIFYSPLRLDEETVLQFLQYFKRILNKFVHEPESIANKDRLMGEEEKRKLLIEFNDTAAEYPRDQSIWQLFHRQVERVPNRVAAVGPSLFPGILNKRLVQVSYRELREKSGTLAYYLKKERNVKADTIVAIKVERSIEMIIGLLGTLEAGGAYLPIDPEYRQERIRYMLKDSAAEILLTEDLIVEAAQPAQPARLTQPTQLTRPHHWAYIIYTSGTTGQPKGAVIDHHNVVRLMFNDKFPFDFSAQDTWTMFHSFCFDFSVWEIYGALLYGGKLRIIPAMTARNSERCLEILKEDRVTVLNQTPSAFYNLSNLEVASPTSELCLRYVIFGGEALTPSRLHQWKAKYPHTKLINMYGITETTVHVTFKELKDSDIHLNASNIGKPIPTLTTYVMDKNLKLVPVKTAGELCVGGEGVGKGYLNRPGLSNEKFVENPYKPGEMLYKSGDLVKVTSTGDLLYLGRIDNQVKIRGYRVEPGEIENRLLKHPDIRKAAVLAREDKGVEKYLCAYLVMEDGKKPDEAVLRNYLAQHLPAYMIPAFFVSIEDIPLTPNGKLDRKRLPSPQASLLEEYTTPTDRVEEKLVKIWADILQIEPTKIGIDTSFFELGGHSLNTIQVIPEIYREFNIKVPLAELFQRITIRELSGYIKEAGKNIYLSLETAERKEYYPLSSAQARIYFIHVLEPENVVYNASLIYTLPGPIDIAGMERAFKQLIQRHESLRTSFVMVEKEPVQIIHDQADFAIEYFEAGPGVEDMVKEFVRPFDLSKAPLLRVRLVKERENRYIFMVDLPHIITDGVSTTILQEDFLALYAREKLPPLKLHFKDFSQWQNRLFQEGVIKQQEEYWLNRFKGNIPLMKLPTDFPRPGVLSHTRGEVVESSLEKELIDTLYNREKETGTTTFMFMMAVYDILLYKYTGQEDILVGFPVTGRSHNDLLGIIGMFVNMLPMKNRLQQDITFREFLAEVKRNALDAYENQDYQYPELVSKLGLQGNLNENPLLDTVFTMDNFDRGRKNQGNDDAKNRVSVIPYYYDRKTVPFDLHLIVTEVDSMIDIRLEYLTQLFKRARIQQMSKNLTGILKQVLENPVITIGEVEVTYDLAALPSKEIEDGRDFDF
jgi:tyrocidine synthetase-3